MKPALKKQWVKALRSGEYKQGRGCMHTVGKDGGSPRFCCLGVLVDIAHEGDWELANFQVPDDVTYAIRDGVDKTLYPDVPAPSILEEMGLDASELDGLTEHNDGGKSFKWIASYIEGRKTI